MKKVKLNISLNEAKVLYKIASKERKLELEKLFPDLKPKSIIDRVKTYEDALKVLNMKHFDETNLYPSEIARRKLIIIAKALNEGWIPKLDKTQSKWYCCFNITQDGIKYTSPEYTNLNISTNMCLKSKDLANYMSRQFIQLYDTMLLNELNISSPNNKKVKCINNKDFENKLTINKIYEVFDIYDNDYYIIKNDDNDIWYFSKKMFESFQKSEMKE